MSHAQLEQLQTTCPTWQHGLHIAREMASPPQKETYVQKAIKTLWQNYMIPPSNGTLTSAAPKAWKQVGEAHLENTDASAIVCHS